MAAGFPVHLALLGAPVIQAALPPPHHVLTAKDLRAPGQPQEQTPVGGPHAEVGDKTTAEPQGLGNKGRESKIFLSVTQAAN